ncbi:hypothetical protein AGMMS49975_23740 [Clostridia bacterium]|nr:hypothetical protein AGMMS49975_23740 [Clostridia bacterium]
MQIGNVRIVNFMSFQGEFRCSFCCGVNVIIGGNSTGKTTLLKLMYAAGKSSLFEYFQNLPKSVEADDVIEIGYFNGIPQEHIFIPEMDMLSHSKSTLAMFNKREIAFDNTYIDILVNAELGAAKEISEAAQKLLDKISDIIGGYVEYENDTFHIVSEDRKTPFSLESSGYRKFGLLWKLLRNGLLESGAVLFWDEPENSLNPELMPELVEILLELQKAGVQIFITTHSYSIAKWFDVKRTEEHNVMFYNLSKKKDGGIKCVSASEYTKLPESVIDKADGKLFKAVVSSALGVGDNDD